MKLTTSCVKSDKKRNKGLTVVPEFMFVGLARVMELNLEGCAIAEIEPEGQGVSKWTIPAFDQRFSNVRDLLRVASNDLSESLPYRRFRFDWFLLRSSVLPVL